MITVKHILEKWPVQQCIGSASRKISSVKALDPLNTDDETLLWCSDKNIDQAQNLRHGVLICSPTFIQKYTPHATCVYLIVDQPRQYFQAVLSHFFNEATLPLGVDESAYIAENVSLGAFVTIGRNVVIEKGCRIGDNTIIGHNTVLHRETFVGKKVSIGCNNTIGGIGFGYEKDLDGQFQLMPHLGNVVLEDFVEIGNNTCIDRAVMGSTILRKNVKVDNLVHIAHGVDVGENSLVIANAMVAGSVKIGKNAWVAPSSSIMNKTTIHDHAVIGMGSIVLRDVMEGQTVVGNPAKTLEKKP